MMRIAIPKGRLQESTLSLFAAAGYDVPRDVDLASRRLVFVRDNIEWVFVKDSDVAVYVEHGAADAGVAGLDQLLEHESTAYQPVELPFGRCRMMLIAAPGQPELNSIATKYPHVTKKYMERRGIRAEVVTVSGSVELAAVLRLTSHVVDLVASGETARVHNLVLEELIAEISPRLIVGRNVYRTVPSEARELIARIAGAASEVAA